jgi:hypothetical protein
MVGQMGFGIMTKVLGALRKALQLRIRDAQTALPA